MRTPQRIALALNDVRRTRRGVMKWRNLHKTLFLVLILGHDSEVCYDCGWHYKISMWAPTPLWCELVTDDGSGLLCARCLNKRAEQAGIYLVFTPMVRSRKDADGHRIPTTNWWLSDTRDWLMMGWADPDCFKGGVLTLDDDIYPTQWPWEAIKNGFADLMAPSMNTWGKPEKPPRENVPGIEVVP